MRTEENKWLAINGEAVYGSSIWRIAAEGPTVIEEGQFTDSKDKTFTSADFRFTVKGSHLYAFCMAYPEDGVITITSLGEHDASRLPKFHGIIDKIEVLGSKESPVWTRDGKGLHITTSAIKSDKPVVFKLTIQ